MHSFQKRCASVATVTVAASLLFCSVAHPASAAQSAQAGTAVPDQGVPTNIAGARAYLAPPAGFNPLTATDAQLAAYNYPPRPGADAPALVHAAWEQAVTSSAARILPTLVQTNVSNGALRPAGGATPAIGNAASLNSYNWSGYADYDSKAPFKNEEILQQFTVPVAQQAFGACTGSYDYGSAWAGIDGLGSPDVLQAGIEFDAYCSGGTKAAFYSAWYEWFPYGEVRISNFPIAPGDLLRVYVWNTSPTAGHAEIINYTTNKVVSIAFSAPRGTTLVGNSVEWVVERPSVGGSLATLTNYVGDPFTFTEAFNTVGTSHVYYPGSAPTGTIYSITMLDNNSKPISISELQGLWDLWFYDEGSAF